MRPRSVVVPQRVLAVVVTTAFVVALLAVNAASQSASQPRDEIFGGYSYLYVNGTADFGVKLPSINTGFDASNTFYFTRTGAARNLGIIADGSGHFDRDHSYVGIGFALGGLQYKYHTEHVFSPFARFLIGGANLSPALPPTPPNYPNQWRFAVGGGGGLDLNVTHWLAIRAVQLDYLYNSYNASFPTSNQNWNYLRLAAGVVISIAPTPKILPAVTCSAQPSEVMEGEPVTVTAAPTNFDPKHALTYAWTSTGGKLDAAQSASAHIDTTGMAAGSYNANATVTDSKKTKMTASCTAAFTVKERPKPPMNPPNVTCSVSPTNVKAGEPVTVTAAATSPDNSEITGYSYQATGGSISGTGTTATLNTAGVTSSGAVTITASATDARNLTGKGNCSVEVNVAPPVSARTPIEFVQRPHQRYIPWRVDNEAKAILDDDATALKNDPRAKLVIVGYADGEKPPMVGKGKKAQPMDLAAQRAVNAKAYLVAAPPSGQGIDPSRIEVRTGTGKQHLADIFWVPEGADVSSSSLLQGTVAVDESKVKPSANAYPTPKATSHRKH